MSRRPAAVALILFVAGLLMSGLVVCAELWSGTAAYADLARDNRVGQTLFVARDGTPHGLDLPAVVELHRRWAQYITGGSDEPPRFDADVRFTDDEYGHMADVRRVFDAARFLVPVGLVVLIVRLQRARAQGAAVMWRLVRDGALLSAAIVALIGLAAVVAFEPLFLLFHYVFFPQGNFLFDPATSNLVRLYPEWYWEGITLRVGLSYLVVAMCLAALAQLRLLRAK